MNGKLNLKSVKLQNFATFSNQMIDFTNNFNTIVGETGSGKSLILDALQMCFGARADKKLVRKDAEFSTIEVTFSCHSERAEEYFDKIGFPFEDEIIIKRVIYNNGKSKSYLNFQACPLSTLTQVARKFIDLVGQFENQKLLSEDYQLKLLDNYSELNSKYKEYETEYSNLTKLKSKLIELNEDKSRSLERRDFLEFQITELRNLSPDSNEEAELKEKKDRILNFEEEQKVYGRISELISDNEMSLLNGLTQLEREIGSLSNSDNLYNRISSLKAELEDISFEVSKSLEIDETEEDINEIVDRLDFYQRLKRKFNTDTDGLVQTLERYQSEFDAIEIIDSEINKTHLAISKSSDICHKIAKELHKSRLKNSTELSEKLTKLVHKLNMNGAIIDIRVSELETLNHSGISALSFYAQTNPGEGFYPIKDIASGGELSRILLALRQVLSQSGSISVFLFDEIDTGVGGETALSIGKALAEVSKASQVIAITHLPQIAHCSDRMILVDKTTVEAEGKSRTMSRVQHINKAEMDPYIKEMQVL
jgi:DNA repair protein RecN (Recombination protein N)